MKNVQDLMKDNDEIMKNRAFGVLVIEGENSLYNADFTGGANIIGDKVVASDNAKKYSTKNYWKDKGLQVFGMRTKIYKKDKGINRTSIMPIGDRYLTMFNVKDLKKEHDNDIYKNLLNCIDVINFGVVFAPKKGEDGGINLNIHGPVQLNYGIDTRDYVEIVTKTIGSPYASGNGKAVSTLGSRTLIDKGYYAYGFTVTPWHLDFLKDLVEGFEGYPRAAYEEFKEASLNDVNNHNSVSKAGVYNMFGLFIELKEGSLKGKTNLNDLLEINENDEGISEIDLTKIYEELEDIKDEIDSIELYYNPRSSTVVNNFKSELYEKTQKMSIDNFNHKL